MTSIRTNSAALSALQSLNMTQQALQVTQNQVSSGLAVANASDNAAYWSVGQQLKADSGIATAANTALAQSQAVLSTANSAVASVITTINAIQTALTQATNPGANLANINTTLASLSSQLTDAINGASFNGTNLLNNNSTNTFVSGFDSQSGAVTSISLTAQALTGGSTGGTTGAYNTAQAAVAQSSVTAAADISAFFALAASGTVSGTPATNANTTVITGGLSTTGVVSISSFDANGNQTTMTYTAKDANGATLATPATAGVIASLSVTRQITTAGDVNTGLLTQAGTTSAQGSYDMTSLGTGGTSVTATNASDMLSAVNQALSAVTNYAATIGATQNRMTAMTNFNNSLTTNYANGVSALVDANMNTASTRLQALQTQEQLGIQSLSIANQNAQLILKLFG